MNIYDFTVQQLKDDRYQEVSLADYKGKVLLVVNTATACGLTPQYEALESLYRKYKDQGFEILDFPCNQFREQAKQDDAGINQFCSLHYDTTFPRFRKIDVNGENAAPIYTWLKQQRPDGRKARGLMAMMLKMAAKANGKSNETGDIKWNFTKFLVDRNGNVVERFEPAITPEKIESEIKKLI